MFINCPHCRALVATDPATDLPPPRCPRCAAQLREDAPVAADGGAVASTDAAPSTGTGPVDGAPGAPAAPAAAVSDPGPREPVASSPVASSPVAPEPVASAPVAPLADDAASATAGGIAAAAARGAAPASGGGGFTLARLLRRRAPSDAAEVMPLATAAATPSPSPSPATLQRRVYAVVPIPDATDAGGDTTRPRTPMPMAMPGIGRAPVADRGPPSAPLATAPTPAVATSATSATRSAATPDARHAPSFVRARAAATPASRRERWALAAAIAGLSLLLAVQWVVADREQLAADARWRPLVQHVCAVVRCTVPPWHEPAALVLLDRDVRPDPAIPDALRVTASFRNDAPWPQAWPLLQLTLSDVDGLVVAEGAFAAADYLGAAPSQPLLAPGQVATVRLVVAEPTPRSVAFAFAFR